MGKTSMEVSHVMTHESDSSATWDDGLMNLSVTTSLAYDFAHLTAPTNSLPNNPIHARACVSPTHSPRIAAHSMSRRWCLCPQVLIELSARPRASEPWSHVGFAYFLMVLRDFTATSSMPVSGGACMHACMPASGGKCAACLFVVAHSGELVGSIGSVLTLFSLLLPPC